MSPQGGEPASPRTPDETTLDPGMADAQAGAAADPGPAFGAFAVHRFTPRTMRRMHWHGHIEANWLERARMAYDIGGREVVVPEGRLALFWASVPHRAASITPLGPGPLLHNVYMPLDDVLLMPGIDRVRARLLAGEVLALDPEACDDRTVRRWRRDAASPDPGMRSLAIAEFHGALRRAEIGGAFVTLGPDAPDVAGGRRGVTMTHVVTMLRTVIDRLDQPLTVAEIAAPTGLNPNYASNLFASAMRVPLKSFVVRLRLSRAEALLMETDASVQAIAFASGFGSVAQFYAAFRARHGMPAGEFRRRAGER